MNAPGNTLEVTLQLSQEIYEQVVRAAKKEQRKIEDLLSVLIAEGLETHATVRELFEQASAQYRGRLTREGKLDQSSDRILEELRTLREQIAGELYP